MKKEWVTISMAEFEDGRERVFRMEPHRPATRRGFPWCICDTCGLVYFNNRLTRWAIKHGCFNGLHPDYAQQVAAASRRNFKLCGE